MVQSTNLESKTEIRPSVTKIIAIEGPRGSGKTTLEPKLVNALVNENGVDAVASVRCFYDPAVWDLIQLTDDPIRRIALAAEDHARLARLQIAPLIGKRRYIVMYRSILSLMVYQGAMQGIDPFRAAHLALTMHPEIYEPHLIFVLDTPAEECARRLKERDGEAPPTHELEHERAFYDLLADALVGYVYKVSDVQSMMRVIHQRFPKGGKGQEKDAHENSVLDRD